MDLITPSLVSATDILDGTKCDGIELTTNLFKDHKMSINETKRQKLETYLRIRFVANTDPNDRKQCYQLIDSNILLVIPPKGSNANKFGADSLEKKRFTFSKIFDEKVNQSDIYDSCGLPIVKRFLSGQNGLLFAYGITSSGKSYTMRGTTTNPGIIPRALNTVFSIVGHKIVGEVPQFKPNSFTECSFLSPEERSLEENVRKFIFDQNDKSYEINSFRSQISVINENSDHSNLWDDVLHSTFRTEESNIRCSVWISFYEIYNEIIYDLLDLEITGERKQKILLLKDDNNNYYIKGLRQICVGSAEEAYKVLLFGQNNLHISSTNLNKNSSRSHCAFSISLVTTFNNTYTKRQSINMNHLSICDLAGAERSEKANNSGQRIREAGKINGSLLSLSRVISTLRHNQKFEHDASKQQFVNYRDSKLTKVFQPFLSGNGMAAMISTMNPTPNLFDETLFALKFTGVASQVIVSSEDQTNKFHDSLKRLTQMWMQSSQRWSTYAALKPSKPSVSIIQTITEEDEEESEGDNECLDMTVEEIERKVGELTQLDLTRVDPQEIEVLRTQIDFLIEKLKQTESDKFEMEVEVRRQVVSEFNKLIKDMEEMADDKDRAKKNLEEMMTKRLITTENLHKKEKLELENRINSMETENFRINEEICQLREERDKAIAKLEEMTQILQQRELSIKELESQIMEYSLKTIDTKCELKDMFTSPVKPLLMEMSTSPLPLKQTDANSSAINLFESKDANTSAINLFESKDANTSAIDMSWEAISRSNQLSDIGVGTSFRQYEDCETSTSNLNEMNDKNTSISIECSDKQTETNCMSFSETTLVYKPIKMESKDCSTSPLISYESATAGPIPPNDNFITIERREWNELKEKFQKIENEMKVKENEMKVKEKLILFHERKELETNHKILELEKEKNQMKDKLNSNPFSIENFKLHTKTSKTVSYSTTSSVASSISSNGVKLEDTNSVSSVESIPEKPKRSSKYSSRKRKPNSNNNVDNRYLSSVNDPSETSFVEEKCSQTSEKSEISDDVGNEIYSTKKSNPKTNKRVNESYDNEDFKDINKGPESKRKRPPLKNLYCSPISPIPSGDRVTRSRAKRAINFKQY